MSTEHVSEILPAYVLGCLEQEEIEQIATHLAKCPECSDEMHEYRSVVDQLAVAALSADPPLGLKDKLLACIEQRTEGKEAQPSAIGPVKRGLTPRLRPALVGLIVLALIAAGLWYQGQRTLPSVPAEPGTLRVIRLDHTDAAPAANALLVMDTDGRHGTLVVDQLPALDNVRQYQLWLIDGSRRVSGAVFSVDPDGYATVAISATEPLPKYSGFGVTVEPRGGSPGPTGQRVLAATP